MLERLSWTRADTLGLGVLVAAAFGAWQAALVADVLGFGPGTDQAATTGAPTQADLAGQRGRAVRPLPGRTGPTQEAARAQSSRPPGPFSEAPWAESGSPRDWAGPIATGLAPRETEEEAAARVAEEYRRLIRDLEFSPGLAEPLQQRVAAQPEPWRPDPEAAHRPPPVIEAVSPSAASAVGGSEVVIRGQHLRAAQVMFGAVAARLASVGPDRVTVVVPPSAPGRVRIALTNEDGHFALAPEPFDLRN